MTWYRWLYMFFFVWEKPRYYQAGARMWRERITQRLWDELYHQRAVYAMWNREAQKDNSPFFRLDTSDGTTSDDFPQLIGKRPITPDSITYTRMILFNEFTLIIGLLIFLAVLIKNI